ncbi:NAD(P)-dependent oxidoreductase [Chloroflexi bacterium TSY]|nr:NAD(P)-dependent oxidoreductase [Chloroflexi bacterium TSY]
MRILVTGGSGRLGRWVVKELRSDHDIIVIDRTAATTPDNVKLVQADHTNLGQIYSVMTGMDAVVHLAAIPSPIGVTPDVVFGNNTMGTFNVAEAAGNLEVKKLIYTSSCSAYGFAFRTNDMVPDYMPLDENHPVRPQDSYGLSKWFGEEILEAATRRTGLTTIAMRIPTVLTPEHYAEDVPQALARPKLAAIGAYVDARDVAQAIRLVLENSELTGHHRFCIAAEDSFSRVPLCESFPVAYPGSEQVAANLTGIHKAPSLLRRQNGYSVINLAIAGGIR